MASNIILLVSISFLFILKRTGPGILHTHGIPVVQLRSPRDGTRISATGSVAYSLAFSKAYPSVSFLSWAGLHFVVAQRNPSLPCAQSPKPWLSFITTLFFLWRLYFFIYIRILVGVLFTYVFTHFGWLKRSEDTLNQKAHFNKDLKKKLSLAVSVPKNNSNLTFICLNSWVLVFASWMKIQRLFNVFTKSSLTLCNFFMWLQGGQGGVIWRNDLGNKYSTITVISKKEKYYVEPHMSGQ